jgi:hypothetical protein
MDKSKKRNISPDDRNNMALIEHDDDHYNLFSSKSRNIFQKNFELENQSQGKSCAATSVHKRNKKNCCKEKKGKCNRSSNTKLFLKDVIGKFKGSYHQINSSCSTSSLSTAR